MNKAVVITTIHAPSPSCQAYARQPGWKLYVVGDTKTPADWRIDGACFMPRADQSGPLAEALPDRSYSRKNLGYLAAIADGAQWLLDSDDDTAPLRMPATPRESSSRERILSSRSGFVNSYKAYGKGAIWPRGLPLDLIHEQPFTDGTAEARCPVRQFMIRGDADVDAVFRLANQDLEIDWEDNGPYAVDPSCYCPSNTQATLWRRPAFPLLYVPATTTMRACDILRGYVAQRCMREENWRLGLGPALFEQRRNPHDYMQDFEDEIPVYLHMRRLAAELDGLALDGDLCDNLLACYTMIVERFSDKGLVREKELEILEAWIQEIKGIVPR